MKIRRLLDRWRRLSPDAELVLAALARGDTLKAHRGLAGDKAYRLHPLDGPAIDVPASAMAQLKARRLIDSNMKFPAATYLLTQRGRRMVSSFAGTPPRPLGSRRY